MKNAVKGVLQGILIGLANIIPGVSGGTVALVLGIYQRLIRALHNVDVRLVKSTIGLLTFKKEAFHAFGADLKRIDAGFLSLIGVGAIGAIGATAKLMETLLADHHAASYAFFSGLVLFSVAVPYAHLKRKSWKEVVSFILAAALTIGMTCMVSDDEQIAKEQEKQRIKKVENVSRMESGTADVEVEKKSLVSFDHPRGKRLAILFLAAALAISAMVLPGVSGSFVLLLLGVYFDVLTAVNERQVIVLGVFALGCMGGLIGFSRIMNVLLEKFFDVTMAFMIGLMAGSLWGLWPFKRIEQVGDETLYLSNVMPSAFGQVEMVALAAFAVGSVLVLGFYVWDRKGSLPKSV